MFQQIRQSIARISRALPIKRKNGVIILLVFLLPILISILPRLIPRKSIIPILNSLPGSFPNADTDLNIYDLILSRNFSYESHFITTSDGYILQLVRIVNPYVKNRTTLKPVMMFHGFQCTGTLWICARDGHLKEDGIYYEFDENNNLVNGSETVGNSLGFVLATSGYDVWLANYRGSVYSSNHTILGIEDSKFWEFSIDEMINIDLPAQIDYILASTGHASLSYIGHSQGNLMMYYLLSKYPHYSNVINSFIGLSPVVYTHKMTAPLHFLHHLKAYFRYFPKRFPILARVNHLYPHGCNNDYTRKLCYYFHWAIVGSPMKHVDLQRISVYMRNLPMGSSSWNLVHLGQIANKEEPVHFDYGDPALNRQKYGTDTPPIYNISNINSTKISIIYTKNDWFNHLDTIHKLKKNLQVKFYDEYEVEDETWNHMELVWGIRVGEVVNKRVLHILDKTNSQ